MTLYGSVLFIHVIFAIALVGASTWAHVAVAQAKRATTTDSLRGQMGFIQVLVKATGPIAGVTVIAGLFLTFDGDWWGAGWPVVSLVLFTLAGISAGVIVDPSVARIKETVDAAPAGPLTADVRTAIADRRLALSTWLMAGADLAIVFLMTNKPGYVGSVAVAGVGLMLGAVLGVRESRHAGVVEVEVATA